MAQKHNKSSAYKLHLELYKRSMGRLLASIYSSLGLDKKKFLEKLSEELNLDYDSVHKYLFNGVAEYYVEKRFPKFFYAIVAAVEKCICDEKLPLSTRNMLREKWKENKIPLLSKFVDMWEDAYQKSWIKFSDNERYNSDVDLLDFMSGLWPATADGSMTKEQTERLRRALAPYKEDLTKKICTNEPEILSVFRRDWEKMKWENNLARMDK